MHMIGSDFSAERYNGLPLVEPANEFVRGAGLAAKMTQRVQQIFVRHQVQDYWGISLLHRHWSVGPSELPGEDVLPGSNPLAYIMRPMAKECATAHVPCLIAIQGNGFEALEFSSEPFALNAFSILQKKAAFLVDLLNALRVDDLHQVFGLSSLKVVSDKEHRLVEMSGGKRTSIMLEVPFAAVSDDDLIQTYWMFSEELPPGCKRECYWDGKRHHRTGHFTPDD